MSWNPWSSGNLSGLTYSSYAIYYETVRSGGNIGVHYKIDWAINSGSWYGYTISVSAYAGGGGDIRETRQVKANSPSTGTSGTVYFPSETGYYWFNTGTGTDITGCRVTLPGGDGTTMGSAGTSTLYAPDAVGPSAPSASLSAGTIVHTNQTIVYASGGSWGDGGANYYAYQYHNGSDWVNFATGGGTAAGFVPGNYGYSYGATIALRVVMVNGFGQTAASNTVYVTCASRPGVPSNFAVSPNPMRRTQAITLSWGAPGAGSGSISGYEIMVRYRANSTASWGNWAGTNNTTQQTPSGYTAFTIKPRGQLQYSIRAQNSYGLWSDYAYVTVDIKGGIVTLKVSSAWKPDGQVYVKVNGAWKEADDIFVKVGGIWKQSL